jgi:hypothetical protein
LDTTKIILLQKILTQWASTNVTKEQLDPKKVKTQKNYNRWHKTKIPVAVTHGFLICT